MLPPTEPDQEELDFMFDEEMEQMAPRKNKFTDWSDEDDSDYELDDQDVNKILIVTQTPPYMRKHPGGDRTGNHESRAKITTDLAKAINDGLYYYEQDLWKGMEQMECTKVKTGRVQDVVLGGRIPPIFLLTPVSDSIYKYIRFIVHLQVFCPGIS